MALKILTLGDSITHGVINQSNTESGGYRTELFNLFAADNLSVDFVGSMFNGSSEIDKNHEGHRGWRIDQIAASVDGWLNTYQPDVVLMMAGTNDVLQNYSLSTAPERLSKLIDQIASLLPNANIVVSSIPPISRSTTAHQQAISFNSSLPEIVNSKVAQGKKVSFTDIFNKLSFNDLADGVHPTAEGYNKIATAWHEAFTLFTNIPISTRVQAEDMLLTNYRIESGNYSALGQELISLYQSSSSIGTASLQFSGSSGIYNIVVGYFDEQDGQAQLSVKVGEQLVDHWVLNQNLGKTWATTETRTRRTVARQIFLEQGTTIEIRGIADQAEFARVDYIEFIPVTHNQLPTDSTPPTASLSVENITTSNGTTHTFTVTYTDNTAINVSTLDNQDIRVIGPNGFDQLATFVSVDSNSNSTSRTATYQIAAFGGTWDVEDNGSYTVALQPNQVKDTSNNFIASGSLGTFQVNIASPLKPLRLEAENMQQSSYIIESGNSAASGSKLISLYQAKNPIGTATTTFNGAAGSYDVVVGYFDEQDGQAQLSVKVGEQLVDQWVLNQNLGKTWATEQTLVRRTIAGGQNLQPGEKIEIQGLANQEEFARVDYIEFLPVAANSTPGAINGTEAVDTLIGSTQNEIIRGFGGNDILNGSAGDDILIGGKGRDSLYGGVGRDTFVFAPGEGTDIISDFVDAEDKLGLSGGLTFNQLTITQGTNSNINNTLIRLTSTGEFLGILSSVQASSITANDFTIF